MTGISAVAAGALLLVSGLCLAVFFRTNDDRWGRANDTTTALFAIAMVTPVVEVRRRRPEAGAWVTVTTALAVVGLLAIAVTSGLTAGKRLDWRISAGAGGVGFAAYLLWMATASVGFTRPGGLPGTLGWWGLGALALALLAALPTIRFVRAGGVGSADLPTWTIVLLTATFLCFPAWAVTLGISL